MAELMENLTEFQRKISDHLESNLIGKALSVCSALIAAAEKKEQVSRGDLWFAHMIKGGLYFRDDDFQKALVHLHEANNLETRQDLKLKSVPCYIASHIKTARALSVIKLVFHNICELQDMLVDVPSRFGSVVHYTELRVLKNLAQGNPFRLYNVGYMNDREEGETFLKIVQEMSGHNIRSSFYSGEGKDSYSPAYVGSFVRMSEKEVEQKNGNLFLWRTYGKNEKEDGAGACIYLSAYGFSGKLTGIFGQMLPSKNDNSQYCIYRVAYESEMAADKELHSALEKLAELLKYVAETDWGDEKDGVYKLVREMLDQIRFLFKSDYYAAEEELRIVQSHYSYESGHPDAFSAVKTDVESFPPRFFVEVENLPLQAVILGPVVRGFREWKQWLKQQDATLWVSKSDIRYGKRD
ncbi:MAG: hypothetical protein MPK09_05180 [Gammaproteobacteria bacterium]|nr:hypothetical protein [Gammaproteobacteria bacterium]